MDSEECTKRMEDSIWATFKMGRLMEEEPIYFQAEPIIKEILDKIRPKLRMESLNVMTSSTKVALGTIHFMAMLLREAKHTALKELFCMDQDRKDCLSGRMKMDSMLMRDVSTTKINFMEKVDPN